MGRAVLSLVLLLLAPLPAQPDRWLSSLEAGQEEAGRSGRPIFLVTLWKTGV